MESYYSYTSNSASSSSANSSTQFPNHYQQEIKSGKPPPAFRSALHSVRRIPAKNIITKKPIAPLPPTPPKVYKVDPVDFKDVVQKLTGAPEFQPTRLQEVAPPPLSLSPPHRPTALFHPPVKKPLLGNLGAAFMALMKNKRPGNHLTVLLGHLVHSGLPCHLHRLHGVRLFF